MHVHQVCQEQFNRVHGIYGNLVCESESGEAASTAWPATSHGASSLFYKDHYPGRISHTMNLVDVECV